MAETLQTVLAYSMAVVCLYKGYSVLEISSGYREGNLSDIMFNVVTCMITLFITLQVVRLN